MPANDLVVYTRTEQFLYNIYPVLINFPKAEKHALSKDIKEKIINILTYISLGNSVPSKRKVYLQEADGYLQALKVLLRLSRQRKYISKGLSDKLEIELTEINKMLSGYIKSSR